MSNDGRGRIGLPVPFDNRMFVMRDITIPIGRTMRDLDIALLRAFVVVADRASMTAAANVLHRTQGAISQQIKRLEEILGCRLFERNGRDLALTSSGARLLPSAKRMLLVHDEIRAEMTKPEFAGRVRLGVPHDLVTSYLPAALKTYADAYPGVDVSLVCGSSPELIEAFAAGKVDLALAEGAAGHAGGECLVTDRLMWVGARHGTAHRQRPVPLSLVSDTCVFRPVILAALRDHGLEWREIFQNDNLDATRAAVRIDIAVSAWLASTVPADLEILSESDLPPLPPFSINLHVRGSAMDAAVDALADHLRRAFSHPAPESAASGQGAG